MSAPRTALSDLHGFIGLSQRRAVLACLYGEERQYFVDIINELTSTVATMPRTYEQEGKGDDAVAYLHYFKGGMDWYITELDRGAATDTPAQFQSQAFGLAKVGHGFEIGYISIPELLENGVELDFHWTPKTLREVKGKLL